MHSSHVIILPKTKLSSFIVNNTFPQTYHKVSVMYCLPVAIKITELHQLERNAVSFCMHCDSTCKCGAWVRFGSAPALRPAPVSVRFQGLGHTHGAHPRVTQQQLGSRCLPPPSGQNSRGKGLVIKDRSVRSKASQFWNNSFPRALVT